MLKTVFLYIVLLLGATNAMAQDVVFSAQATAEKMGIEDQVQIQYTIKNTQDIKRLGPDHNELSKDFHILGGPFTSQSSQIYVNDKGQMAQSMSVSMTYVLQPKHTGKLTIPAAIAQTNAGDTYKSNSVPIEVVKGSIAPPPQQQQRRRDPFFDDPFEAMMRQRQRQMQALQQQRGNRRQQQPQPAEELNLDKDLFIKVVVDKNKVHVGEQITASYKLYARVPMNVNISKLPSLNGFWTQDFDMPKGKITPVEEIVNGERYQVFTLKKSALFPQQTGTLELDPAEAEGVARVVQKIQQDPFFQNSFGSLFMDDPFFNDDFFSTMAYRDVPVKLKSSPVKIQVEPLPEKGKPEHYGGAVGAFTIESSLDKKSITTDDVVNLKLTISGSGNIKLIEAPVLELPNGLTSYDPAIVDTITGRSTTISGSKIITYTITPRTPGDYDIPSIPFSYFNTRTGKYVTLNTEPAKLHVDMGKGYKQDAHKEIALTDIHDINTGVLPGAALSSKPVILTVGYWSLYAVPLFAFIGILAWKRREDELSKDVVSLKRRRANKIALKRLTTAKALLQKNEKTPFYEEVSKAIWLYLSDKLNIPLSSLSRDNVWDALQSRDIDRDMQKQVERVMDECETALYAGSSGAQQMSQTYNDAVEVISKLEESFKA